MSTRDMSMYDESPSSSIAEHNKRLTAEFFGRFTAGDIAGVLDAMTDDATWWMAGKPGLAPVAGLKTKAEMATVLERLTGRLRTSLTVTVKSMIAEGNKVAVELESYGELRKDARTTTSITAS